MARFTFFIGKGGVGKTTVSSAYALHRAAKSPRRQNPAALHRSRAFPGRHSADQSFRIPPKRLATKGQLWARQIDPDRQIKKFLARERADILALLNKGSLFTRDELEPLLDTSLPGMAEVAALLALHELLASEFDEIVVDTAPMGHAIRLFQMPEHFARFLDVLETAASRDVVLAQHFGGRVQREPALDRWARMVEEVEEALSARIEAGAGHHAGAVLAERSRALGGARFKPAERKPHLRDRAESHRWRSRWLSAMQADEPRRAEAARKFLRSNFPRRKLLTAEDPGCPILGIRGAAGIWSARLRGQEAFAQRRRQGAQSSSAPT